MIIANILGIFVLMFLLWYKLKDDYHYEKIFDLAFFVIFGIFVSSVLLNFIPSIYLFWIFTFCILIFFLLGVYRLKMKFYESLDGLIIATLPYLGLFFLVSAIKNFSLFDFIGFWIVTLFVFLYFFLESNYRKFNWYKSGRVGFSGLMVGGLLFLVRGLISLYFPQVPTIIGGIDLYLSATFSFLFFLLLFNLSRKVA